MNLTGCEDDLGEETQERIRREVFRPFEETLSFVAAVGGKRKKRDEEETEVKK